MAHDPESPAPTALFTPALYPVAGFTALYLAVAVAAAVRFGNIEFVFYIGVMLVLIVAVAFVYRAVRLSSGALWALSVWGLLHMMGGLVQVPAGWPTHEGATVLYSLWLLPGRLKYDQVVHAFGFGITTWVCWQALSAAFRSRGIAAKPSFGLLVLVWAAGLGFGAVNEVVEFAAVLLIPNTNVGGYVNTGWDLVANMTGATVAALLIGRFTGRDSGASP
jgi:uncharacterized membrane protein YjdF